MGCKPDGSLAENFAFCLCRMMDESVSTANSRDKLLRIMKWLNEMWCLGI